MDGKGIAFLPPPRFFLCSWRGESLMNDESFLDTLTAVRLERSGLPQRIFLFISHKEKSRDRKSVV